MRTAFLLASLLAAVASEDVVGWGDVKNAYDECKNQAARRLYDFGDNGGDGGDVVSTGDGELNEAFKTLMQCVEDEFDGQDTKYQGDLVEYLLKLIGEDDEVDWGAVEAQFEAHCIPETPKPKAVALQYAVTCIEAIYPTGTTYQAELVPYLDSLVSKKEANWDQVAARFEECREERRLQADGMNNDDFNTLKDCIVDDLGTIYQGNLVEYLQKLIAEDQPVVNWDDVADKFEECLEDVEAPKVKSQSEFNSLLECVRNEYDEGTVFQGDLPEYVEELYKKVGVNNWDDVRDAYEDCKEMPARRLYDQGRSANGMLSCVMGSFEDSPYYQGDLVGYLQKLKAQEVVNWDEVRDYYNDHCEPEFPVGVHQAQMDALECVEAHFGKVGETTYQGDLKQYINNDLLPETVNWDQVRAILKDCQSPDAAELRVLFADKQSAVVEDAFASALRCVIQTAKKEHDSVVFQGNLEEYVRILLDLQSAIETCAEEELTDNHYDIEKALQKIRDCVDRKMQAKCGDDWQNKVGIDIVQYLKRLAGDGGMIIGEQDVKEAYEHCREGSETPMRRLVRARVDPHVSEMQTCMFEFLRRTFGKLLIFDLNGQSFEDWLRNRCENDKPVVRESDVKEIFYMCLEEVAASSSITFDPASKLVTDCVNNKLPPNAKVQVNVDEWVRQNLAQFRISSDAVVEYYNKYCGRKTAVRKLMEVPGAASPNLELEAAVKCVVNAVTNDKKYPLFAVDLRQFLAGILSQSERISRELVNMAFAKCFEGSGQKKRRLMKAVRPAGLKEAMVMCVKGSFPPDAQFEEGVDVVAAVGELLNAVYEKVGAAVEEAFEQCVGTGPAPAPAALRSLMQKPNNPQMKITQCVMEMVPDAAKFPEVLELLNKLIENHMDPKEGPETLEWDDIAERVEYCYKELFNRRLEESPADDRITKVQAFKLRKCLTDHKTEGERFPLNLMDLLVEFIKGKAVVVPDDEVLEERLVRCKDTVLGPERRLGRRSKDWKEDYAKEKAERQAKRDAKRAKRTAKRAQREALKRMDVGAKETVDATATNIAECVISRYPPNADFRHIDLDARIKKKFVVYKFNFRSYNHCKKVNRSYMARHYDSDEKKKEYFDLMEACVANELDDGEMLYYGSLRFHLSKRIRFGWFQ